MQAQRNEDRTDTHWSKQANRRTNRDIDRRRKRHAETDYNNKDYNNKKTERRERSWQQTDPSKDPRTDEDFSECTDCQTDVDTQTEMLWREVTGQRGRTADSSQVRSEYSHQPSQGSSANNYSLINLKPKM